MGVTHVQTRAVGLDEGEQTLLCPGVAILGQEGEGVVGGGGYEGTGGGGVGVGVGREG